jgi:hypothetical protein
VNDLDVEAGQRARAFVASISLPVVAPLNSDTIGLHLDIECRGDRPAEDTRAIESMMTAELTSKVVAWATEIAGCAAELPSRHVRDAYLAARRSELMAGALAEGANERDAVILADACVDAARRIMTELLAQRAGAPPGRG